MKCSTESSALEVQEVDLAALGLSSRVELYIARLDLFDAAAPGNKWFKLQPNLDAARAAGKTGVLSFGGAWSNHLHALAATGREAGLRTHGMVRGDASAPISATLRDVMAQGMTLEFVTRAEYRQRANPDFLAELGDRYPDFHFVPEGGANAAGARGCIEIARRVCDVIRDVDYLACACGTGTTLAGLAAAGTVPVRGYSVLRDGGSTAARVERLLKIGRAHV